MKYRIVYLIKGEAAYYQKNLSDELAKIFGLEQISRRIPPHLTLKAPFETRTIGEIEKILERFAAGNKAAPLVFEGFGHFDRRVIFMDGKPSTEATTLVNNLTSELKKLPWIKFEQKEMRSRGRLYATIAVADYKKLFDELAQYIKGEKSRFEVMLDNVAILEKEKEKETWRLHSEYTLQPTV